ncbi:MAG: segregation/condensation protein A [Candidatus Sumerlaeaceae bacterium]|nr:segregation/condensation protein A [Candidatus Sumerlaeaceae bacterium]
MNEKLYTIKLPVFEGPFDLLLHLIKINEMDIHDIPIAEITRQYLDYIHVMKELDLELAGEFLVMAATLIHLKARTLLPAHHDDEENDQQDEEVGEIVSARELMQRLIEYRKYKEVAAVLREREEQHSLVIYRTTPLAIAPEPTEELSAEISLLYRALARVLRYLESNRLFPNLSEQFTVEQKIEYIESLLESSTEIDLMAVFLRCLNKLEIITTFLAVLELVRLKRARIQQNCAFDTIMLVARDAGDGNGQA